VCEYLDGRIGLAEAVRLHKLANHRLVRRQHAWFKPSDPRITWVDGGRDAAAACVSTARSWLASLRN
jgi:tRNA A37 N6-isopentenylltransferase MiaA